MKFSQLSGKILFFFFINTFPFYTLLYPTPQFLFCTERSGYFCTVLYTSGFSCKKSITYSDPKRRKWIRKLNCENSFTGLTQFQKITFAMNLMKLLFVCQWLLSMFLYHQKISTTIVQPNYHPLTYHRSKNYCEFYFFMLKICFLTRWVIL